MTFPLEQWFDITKPISKDDAEDARDQMLLYAFKDGLDPDSHEVKHHLRELKLAVRAHNEKFRKSDA